VTPPLMQIQFQQEKNILSLVRSSDALVSSARFPKNGVSHHFLLVTPMKQ
jgi:hypothetical protein